jgi:hypothetical protein
VYPQASCWQIKHAINATEQADKGGVPKARLDVPSAMMKIRKEMKRAKAYEKERSMKKTCLFSAIGSWVDAAFFHLQNRGRTIKGRTYEKICTKTANFKIAGNDTRAENAAQTNQTATGFWQLHRLKPRSCLVSIHMSYRQIELDRVLSFKIILQRNNFSGYVCHYDFSGRCVGRCSSLLSRISAQERHFYVTFPVAHYASSALCVSS